MAEAKRLNTVCECFLDILPSIQNQKGATVFFNIETTISVYQIITKDWEHFKVQFQNVLEYDLKVKVIDFELSHENELHMLFICRFAAIHENQRFQTLVDEGKVTIILTKYAENNGFAVEMGFDPNTNFKVQLSVSNSKTHTAIKEEKKSSRMCSFKTPKRGNMELLQISLKHICQPCETEDTVVPAVKWCTECEENLCKDCFQFHKKGKATKNHHVLNISEAGIFPTLGNHNCLKHNDMLLDLFCVDHDALTCRQCMTEEHRACNKLLPLDVAAKDVASSALVSDLLKDFEISVTALCSIETAIEKELKVEEDQRRAKQKHITSLKIRLHKQIDKSASVSSETINTVSKEHRLHLQEQEHSITESKVSNIKHKEELEKVIKHGSNSQIFILAHHLKLLQTKEEASSIDVCQKLDKIEIHFPKKHELPSSSFFGDISIKKTPLNVHAKFSKAQVAENIPHNDSVKKLHHNSTNVFRSPIRGIAITKNNDVLLCGEANSTVLRCFPNGKVDKSCEVDSESFNICVIDETDEAVVTLPNTGKIQFIKYIPMEAGKTVDTLSHPWGITLCKDKLVVGSCNKMQFFTKDGKPLHIVDVPLRESTSICFMQPGDRNQIYLSCSSFYSISDNGNSLFKHSAPFNRRTNGICIDRDGSIYVASQNSVVRLSKEGTVLDQDILDKKNQYGAIWGIAFNRTYTQIYAATNDGLQLTVFDFK